MGYQKFKRIAKAAVGLLGPAYQARVGTRGRVGTKRKRSARHRKSKYRKGIKNKLRTRRSRSYTKTTTKTETDTVNLSSHNDMSLHRFYLKPIGTRKIRSKGAFKYIEQKQGITSVNAGLQLVDDLQFLMTKQQLTGNTSSSRFVDTEWSTNPFELNPFVTVPSSTLYPGPIPGVVAGDSIAIDSCNYRLDLLNMENIPIEVEIFWFVSKDNHNYSPLNWWLSCIQEERLNQPIAAAVSTSTILTNTAGYRTIDSVGNHPYHYRSFKKMWRQIGHYKVILQSGHQHSMVSKLGIHKVLRKNVLDSLPDVSFVKGITVVPMVIAHAGIIGYAPGLAASSSVEVVNGPVKLGYKQEVEYKFNALPIQRLHTTRIFEGLVEPTGDFTTRIIDDEDELNTVQIA